MAYAPPPFSGTSDQKYLAAIGWMLISSLAMACMWGLIKYCGQVRGYHPFMLVVARNTFGLLFCLPMILQVGLALLQTDRIGNHLRRATSGVVATLATFYAISHAPLATAMSISYAAPLIATVGAVFFLGERIRIRRILALVVGFAGVMIVLRPGQIPLTLGIMASLIACVATAFSIITMKLLSATDDPRAVVIYSFILMLVPSLLAALPSWQWPRLNDVPALAAIGLMAAVGQFSIIRSYQLAEVTALLPFDFVRFSSVILIGWIFFQERMDGLTILGGLVIFASTLYLAHRERRVAKAIKTVGQAPES